MTTNEKAIRLTNKLALQYAICILSGETPSVNFPEADVVEKLNGMIAQLDKKNSAPRKATKTQLANAENIGKVVEFLGENEPTGFTCADLIKHVPALAEKSNQYVSAIMKVAIESGQPVHKYTDKRKTYFAYGKEGA